jgi:eukaryotic-like serine/threonine-protein kinase
MPLTPATRLGPYEIVDLLGVGGMGEVYRARDPRLKRDIAIKVLPHDVASSPERLARFEREATTVAGLNHPNIVVLHSIEEASGTRFLTMELVDGQSLVDMVRPGGVEPAELLDVAIPLVDALVAAHQKNVVHRDLKPANVMVTREGRVKVLDFGLAKLVEQAPDHTATQAATVASPISQAGQTVGTVSYMAPEQLRGDPVDVRADLFSVGILLYELATGARPFKGRSLADVSSAILRDFPPPLRNVRPDVPSELERIVHRCLEKDPGDRFQTAIEVLNELRALWRTVERGAPPTGKLSAEKPPSIAPRPLVNRSSGAGGERTGMGPQAAWPAQVTRLIVLPFRMLRPDPDTEFLAFSLPEAVAGALGGLQSLVVRSTMAAARFAGDSLEPQKIAVEADVDVIVTGTLLRAGGDLRVSTQLTDASSATLLWSHSAQAPVDDLFRVQDDLTQRIVDSLALPLTSREQSLLQRDVPANAKAYACFLHGNQLSYDAKHWSAAREFYLQSVAEDPGYAPAWARLGRIHHVLGKYHPEGTPDGLVQAEGAFRQSLELNPDLTIAHKLFAQLEVDLGHAHDAMVRLIERARTADPELLAGLVTACRYCGLLDASLAAHMRAITLDAKIRTSVAHTWFLKRDYERVASGKVAESPYITAIALGELGRKDATIVLVRELESKTTTRMRDFMASARALLEGNRAESIAAVRRIVDSDFRDPEGLFYLTRHFAHLGDTTAALELFERVVSGGYFCYPAMVGDPWLEPLRENAGFTKLLQQAESQHRGALAAFERLGGSKILRAAPAAVARSSDG